MAIFARIGGSNCGNARGDGNGKPGGVGGEALPLETSGLLASGRSWRWPMSVNSGSVPRRVLVSSDGTSVADDCTQLFEPATLRPLDHGSRLVGAQ